MSEFDPIRLGPTIAAIVDTLIPGDGVFPSASSAGVHGQVLDRFRRRLGFDALAEIASTIGEDFAERAPADRLGLIEELERTKPDHFATLRFATYLSYYETPAAIAALRSLGHDYNAAPQPLGYEMAPFDPACHLPAAPRGTYLATESVRRVDLSALDELGFRASGD